MLKRGLPPAHPGEILRGLFMEERKLTITSLAKGLGMTRANLSATFGNSAEFWMNLQKNYELWHAEKKVKRSAIKHFYLTENRQRAIQA